MKAVILAAGKGTRLQPITNTIPKGLIEVNSKPILAHIFDSVSSIVDEIILVIGHKGELIKNYFKLSYNSIPIKYVYQEQQLGTGHALLCAKEYLDGDFIVLNGDDIYHFQDITKLSDVPFGVLSIKVENWENFGVLKINETSNTLIEIIEKPKYFISSLINTGVYKLHSSIFEYELNKSLRGEYEIIDYLNYLVSNKFDVHVVKISKYWLPINTHEQLDFARTNLKNYK